MIRSLVLEQKPIGKGNSRNFQNNVGSTRHPLPFSVFSLSLVGHGRVFWPRHCHPLPGGCSYVKTPLFPHPRLSVKPDDQPNPTHAQIFSLVNRHCCLCSSARGAAAFSWLPPEPRRGNLHQLFLELLNAFVRPLPQGAWRSSRLLPGRQPNTIGVLYMDSELIQKIGI
jgi:hypothetical protein